MSAELLDKSRKLSRLFRIADCASTDIDCFSTVLGRLLGANIAILAENGEVVFSKQPDRDSAYLKMIACFENTRENLKDQYGNVWLATPIMAKSVRLGTLCAIKEDQSLFDIEDIVMAENAAVLLGLDMLEQRRAVIDEAERKQSMARAAMRTLSATEEQAVVVVFDELGGSDGLLVTSKIADKAGITRSVIINAMRKLESAGVVVCKSSGMKGTNIKVVNEMIYEELVLAKGRR